MLQWVGLGLGLNLVTLHVSAEVPRQTRPYKPVNEQMWNAIRC